MKQSKKTKTNSQRLRSRPLFSRSGLIGFVLIFAAIGGYVLWHSLAAVNPPAVYLTPATNVVGSSNSFSVQVRENSGTTPVNAIQAVLSYPTTQLTLVSVDYTNSAFGTQAQSSFGGGSISMARGVSCSTTCPALTGDQLVATLNFTSTTTGGTANVTFGAGIMLIESTTNTNILTNPATMAIGGTYTVDTFPPTISITSPQTNAVLGKGSTINITVNANDANSSVTKVEYYIDGTKTGTVTTSPFTYAWNTSSLTLASHTIQAKAYDSFNNIGSSTTISVNLADLTVPSTPASLRTVSSTPSSISLAWNASTDNVGVTGYKVTRDTTLLATVSSTTLTYTDSGLSAGTNYTYKVQAIDAAGNTSNSASLATATPALKAGDLNGDGSVGLLDLSILLSHYGLSATASEGDINGNGAVDLTDLSILLSHYGL
jgi:hypothetical protein